MKRGIVGKKSVRRQAKVLVGVAVIDGRSSRQCYEQLLIKQASVDFKDLNDPRIGNAENRSELGEVLCELYNSYNGCCGAENTRIAQRLYDFITQNSLL
jgi:hypothetical protein